MWRWLAGAIMVVAVAAPAIPAAAVTNDPIVMLDVRVTLAPVGSGYVARVTEDVTIYPDRLSEGGEFVQDLPDGAALESVKTFVSQDLPFTLGSSNRLRVPLSQQTTGFDMFTVVYSVEADVAALDGDEVWTLPISGAQWQTTAADIFATLSVPDEYFVTGTPDCDWTATPCLVDRGSENEAVVFADDVGLADEVRVSIGFGEHPTAAEGPPPVDSPQPVAVADDCPPMPPASFTDGFASSVPDHCAALKEQRRWLAKPGLAIVIVSVLAIALTLIGRRRHHRGPPPNDIIIAQYAPPKGLNIMVAAHLLGRSRTAVPAQLLALALSKNLRILERTMRRGRRRYAVQFITFDRADELGAAILRALFSDYPTPGAIRELQAGDRALGRRVARVSGAALREVRQRHWRRSGGWLQWLLLVIMLLVTLISGPILIVGWLTSAFSPWFLIAFFAAPIALTVCFVNLRFVGAVTPSGALVRDHLVGIRDYLRLAEADRLRLLQGADTAQRVDHAGANSMVQLYEKLLPYAVVWGVDESWIRQLVGNSIDLDAAPEWLSDPNLLTVAGAASQLSAWGSKVQFYSATQVRRLS